MPGRPLNVRIFRHTSRISRTNRLRWWARELGQFVAMDDVLANNLMATINRALRDRRYSASRASTEAGSSDLIRNIRRGRMPSMERLKALCEVLDLDFYVGPRRHAGAIDVRRLREAIASTERTCRRPRHCPSARGEGGAGSRTHRGARASAGRRALWGPFGSRSPALSYGPAHSSGFGDRLSSSGRINRNADMSRRRRDGGRDCPSRSRRWTTRSCRRAIFMCSWWPTSRWGGWAVPCRCIERWARLRRRER